jgi:hypothetical protein
MFFRRTIALLLPVAGCRIAASDRIGAGQIASEEQRMTRQILLAAAAAVAMIATPALADKGRAEAAAADTNATSAEASAPAAAMPKAERKTCRTFANTVSRLKSERLCYTREQWEKFNATQ